MRRAASGGPKAGPYENLPVVNEPLIAEALGLEEGEEEFAQVGASRVAQDQRALDGAQDIALLSTAIGGERGPRAEGSDGVGLILPFSPGRRLREVRAQGLTHARPVCVAKHVDEIQVSRHQRFQGALRHHRLSGASPVTQSFTGARWADAPLMHAQGHGAEDELVLVPSCLAQVERRSSPTLMGRGLPFFFSCQQSRVRVRQRAAGGSEPGEILQ